jgi:hypothetical protein
VAPPTRASRGKVKVDVLDGRDTYRVVGADVPAQAWAAVALTRAQTAALNATDPITLTVCRDSLFGAPAELYRVVRTEDGVVLTFTVDQQD